MRRLILDHYRRWWFVLVPAALFTIGVGGAASYLSNHSYMFFLFMVTLWVGAVLLGRDLQRGLVRTALSLPLTARQIGYAWWYATVGIPSVVMCVLLFLGAAVYCQFHPLQSLPWPSLAGACLFSLLWLGNGFTSIYGMTNELFGNWRQRFELTVIGLLSVFMLFGSMICSQHLLDSPKMFAVFCGIGVIVTAASWLRAERFVAGQAGFRLTALQAGMPKLKPSVPVGSGGLLYLFHSSLTRSVMQIVFMAVMVSVAMCFFGAIPADQKLTFLAPIVSFLSLLLVIGNQGVQAVQQLRSMRVLPISVTRLALALVGFPVLSLALVGFCAGTVAAIMLGVPAGLFFAKAFLIVLGPAAVCIPVVVALGSGIGAPITIYACISGCAISISFSHTRLLSFNLSWSMAALAAVGCVVVSLFFTRLALRRSSRPYRPHNVQVLPAGC